MGVAAGVGDQLGVVNGLPLLRLEFRQTVNPALCYPVRGAGVNKAGISLRNPAGNLFGSIVRKTEYGNVSFKHLTPAFLGAAAQFLRQRQEFNVFAAGHPLVDAQARGAGVPINENFGKHCWPLVWIR